MGVQEKLKEKLGREPTEEEVSQARDQKRLKKAAKAAAALEAGLPSVALVKPVQPPAPVPAADGASPPIKAKRKRNHPSDGDMITRALSAAADAAASSRGIAVAVGNESRSSALIPEGKFSDAWEAQRSAAERFWAEASTALDRLRDGGLHDDAYQLLLSDLRDDLMLARTESSAVIAACKAKLPKPKKVKGSGTQAKATKVGSGRGRAPAVKPDVLDRALMKIKAFDYDLFDATSGKGAAYLNLEELKQLTIQKAVYDQVCERVRSDGCRKLAAPACRPTCPHACLLLPMCRWRCRWSHSWPRTLHALTHGL